MSKLEQFCIRQACIQDEFMYMNMGLNVYHYTSVSGFESILFSKKENIELWASRYDCLNDMSEGSIAVSLFQDVCKNMYADEEIQEDLYNIIKNIELPDKIILSRTEDWCTTASVREYKRYIASFSLNADSLAMWNYYSKGSKYEGFNIGFDTYCIQASVIKNLNKYDRYCTVNLYPVVYEKSMQKDLVRSFLNALNDCYEEGAESKIINVVSQQLLRWALVFKSEYFKHEEEVRLIVDIGKGEISDGADRDKLEVKYRVSNGYNIPYIVLGLDKTDLSQVTIGPLLCDDKNKENQKAIVNERLAAHGYHDVAEFSKIPIRY